MQQHALKALEFARVMEIVAGYATSEPGAQAVMERRPLSGHAAVEAELQAADEVVSWLIRDDAWAPPVIPDVRGALDRLAIEGSVWSVAELLDGLELLRSARQARRSILPHGSEFHHLGALAEGLLKDEELVRRLEGSLDEEAEDLKDDATSELRRLRRSVRSTRAELVDHLEGVIAGLSERVAVPNASVTVRGGRYCIPIRREGRSKVGGIVHDESASRATLFVEPPSAIELMNDLREFELAEKREVERILAALTDALRPPADALHDTLDRLIELDSLFARASFALDRGCARPRLVRREEDRFRIVDGRHPLLLETRDEVVPFELVMHPGECALLVTGPNAGGKTVLLKALGLISAMAQAGVLPTVGQGTEIPVYTEIYADIGDEQSIDASLSTFTAHLRNLTEILERADADSLCLIDEIGGATDPVEGTALARAVLLELAERGCMTAATSHLGGLKTLPGEHPGIVSAGLGFDPERLEPLYRLTKGRPGRSYALAIARRVGFPEDVIETAREGLSAADIDVERLLAELEEKEAELADRLAELERRERELQQQEAELERRSARSEARERELERQAHERAHEFLLEARKKLDEAMRAEREETARRARGELEASLREHSRALEEQEEDEAKEKGEAPEVEPGDRVRVSTLDREGRVVEVRGDEVVVEVGGVKLQLAPAALRVLEGEEPDHERESVSTYTAPADGARSEIDLRGLLSDEARAELIRALDAAVQAGLSELRVIHGKGTGALRRTVDEYVRSDKRVRSHRLGAPPEGGTGVTILELD